MYMAFFYWSNFALKTWKRFQPPGVYFKLFWYRLKKTRINVCHAPTYSPSCSQLLRQACREGFAVNTPLLLTPPPWAGVRLFLAAL